MKKTTSALFALLLCGQMAFSQAVADQALIPVSVTLNAILRLNVSSGGNIEFVVNTIDQYTSGISNSTRYTTKFTVASSQDFDVALYAEDANLLGADNVLNTMPLDNVGYVIRLAGTGLITDYNLAGAAVNPSVVRALTNATFAIVESNANLGAGGSAKNAFDIEWCLNNAALRAVTLNTTLLAQSIAPDRYSTNVFLVLTAAP